MDFFKVQFNFSSFFIVSKFIFDHFSLSKEKNEKLDFQNSRVKVLKMDLQRQDWIMTVLGCNFTYT